MHHVLPRFLCGNCGKPFLGEAPGVCPVCGSPRISLAGGGLLSGFSKRTTSLKDAKNIEYHRWKTGVPELDEVLGGGLVKDSAVMFAGERGAGKSTVLTTVLHNVSRLAKKAVLYASGEETGAPFKARAARLGASGNELFRLIADGRSVKLTELHAAIAELKPAVAVVDSIQRFEDDISPAKGRLEKELAITRYVTQWAKQMGFCAILIGQFTKEGIAGKYELQHEVDVVLTLTIDQKDKHRVLEAIKNRFGATDRAIKMSMTASGLKTSAEIAAASGIKAVDRVVAAGAVAVPIVDGGTATVIELLAALFDHAEEGMAGNARREAIGIDKLRFGLILALLQKHCGVTLMGKDLFVEIPTAESTVSDRAMDLAIMASVVCAENGIVIPSDWAIFGTVSVHGNVAMPVRMDDRIAVLKTLGYRRFIGPKQCKHVNQLLATIQVAIKDVRATGDVCGVDSQRPSVCSTGTNTPPRSPRSRRPRRQPPPNLARRVF